MRAANINYLFLLAVFIFIAGCSVNRGAVERQKIERSVKETQKTAEMNSEIMQKSMNFPASPADYLIGPADLIEVKVFESEKLSTTARVSSRGFITMPLIGNVDISDMTAREAEIKIEKLLKDGGYLRSPNVSIFIKEHKSKMISVVGEVVEPGKYEMLGRQTVLDALADAKGLKPQAGKSIYINRVNDDGSRKSYIVDIENLLAGKDVEEANVDLQPGDMVFVPKAGNVFVEGAVDKPGAYSIKEGETTVSQAVIMAGGTASYASEDDVTLIRFDENGQRQIIDLNLENIKSGQTKDPVVHDRDAIVVGASGLKKLIHGLRLSLGFGLVGVGYDPPDRRYGY